MRSKMSYMILGFVLMLAATASAALANDSIISGVSIPSNQPIPIVQENGSAKGTIQLYYKAIGSNFPCGEFAQFSLDLTGQQSTNKQGGSYPAYLKLQQIGNGSAVKLTADPSSWTVPGYDWEGSSTIRIFIDCSQIPSNPLDGAEIVGNLNESATISEIDNRSAHIDTITNIQVHITLSHPTTCLKLYSFESYQDPEGTNQAGDLLTSIGVTSSNGNVRSTDPGQVSVDAMVINICTTPQSFDLGIGLDPLFETNPNGNSGNATFTYRTYGNFEPQTYTLSTFGAGSPEGEILCLGNVTLGAGEAYLVRVHSALQKKLLVSDLPQDFSFDFGATLFVAATECKGALLDASLVTPANPAESHLAFTLKTNRD